MPGVGAQPEIFQGRGDFVELGQFDKYFVKNTRKKGLAGKNFRVFSPRYFSKYILNGKYDPKINTTRPFFPKTGHFF